MKKFKFKNFFPKRIWQQIFVVIAPLVVIPLLLLGILLTHTSQKTIVNTIYEDRKELALRAASEINEFIKKPKELLQITAAILGALNTDQWRQETVVVELVLGYPMFRQISSVNMRGQEIVTSNLGQPLEERLHELAFQEAAAGNVYMSELKVLDEALPTLTMAVPIRQLGHIRGVLMADVNVRGFWDIVDSIRIGETGQAFVINKQGLLLVHPDKKKVLGHKDFSHQMIIRDIIEGKSGVREVKMEDGDACLLFYAPIKETEWGLVIFQPIKEAYAPLRMMWEQSKILIFLSILAALIISIFLARFMSRPINMLLDGAKRLARGDFNHPLEVKRSDEIGRLLMSFNYIIKKVKNAQQVEKLSVIGKAATAMVHELKNSLILVNTYMQLLQERYQDKNFILEFCRIIPQELNSWKGMLQNVIDYSKLHQFPMEDVDICALIKGIVALAEVRVKQHGVELIVQISSSMPLIEGNVDKLRQVLLNLISNALEAMPRNDGTITLKAEFVKTLEGKNRAYIVIEVHNTGKEISSKMIRKIFEPFYSTKVNGLGLGLAVSKEVVELHGGRIEARSSEENGTSFMVYLPVNKKA